MNGMNSVGIATGLKTIKKFVLNVPNVENFLGEFHPRNTTSSARLAGRKGKHPFQGQVI